MPMSGRWRDMLVALVWLNLFRNRIVKKFASIQDPQRLVVMVPRNNLDLTSALRDGRLDEFINLAENSGIGPIGEAEFDETASLVIRKPQSDDQTSHSPRRDGSRGK